MKKTPTMIQRLKKWKKYKGISKEDIEKFATDEEKQRLLENDDPFDIPIGDPQDPTDDEPRPLGDEQETINVDWDAIENIIKNNLPKALETGHLEKIRDDCQLLVDICDEILEGDEEGDEEGEEDLDDDESGLKGMKPWEKY